MNVNATRTRIHTLCDEFQTLQARGETGTQTEADRRRMGENRAERFELGRQLAATLGNPPRSARPARSRPAVSRAKQASPAPASAPEPRHEVRARGERLADALKSGVFDRDTGQLEFGLVRDLALHEIENRSSLAPAAQDRLSELVRNRVAGADGKLVARHVLVTSRPAYRSAFVKSLTSGALFDRAEAEAVAEFRLLAVDVDRAARADVSRQINARAAKGQGPGELRAMSEGSDGGLGVPYDLDTSLIVVAGGVEVSQMLNYAKAVVVTTNNYHAFAAPATGFATLAEGAVGNDEAPTFSGPDIPVWTGRNYLPFSVEFGQDQAGWVDNATQIFSEGYADYISNKTAIGSGSSDVTGIFTRMVATTTNPSHVTVTTAGTIGAVDVRAAWAALPERYRVDRSCAWVMSPTVAERISALSAASGGLGPQELTTDPATGNRRLFGRPVLEVDAAPSFTGTTGAASYCVVGALARYTVATRLGGFTVELINHLFDTSTGRPTGQRAFLAFARVGGDVVDPNAFRLLSNS